MNDERLRLNMDGGEEVNVIVDRATGTPRGRIVLVPPFGMSGERLFPASYILTLNGFDVLRCDPRDQPGESSGFTETFRLSRLTEDISRVLKVAPDAILIAMSLSGRCALRALATNHEVSATVLVSPVVNVRGTLLEVLGDDWFKRIAYDDSRRVRVLGHMVDTDFIRDCVASNFVNLDDTLADVLAGGSPITIVAGDADPWVSIDDIRSLASQATDKGYPVRLTTVRSASHQLYRNPVLAMKFIQIMTSECLRLAGDEADAAVLPPFSEIVAAVAELGTSRAMEVRSYGD